MKSGSAVLTMFEKATVPKAGASVDVTWPVESSAATGSSRRTSAPVRRGGCLTGFQTTRPSSSRARRSGSQSGSMHTLPTARWSVASAHGCGHELRHSLFARLKTTLSVHHSTRLIAMPALRRPTERGGGAFGSFAVRSFHASSAAVSRVYGLAPPRKARSGRAICGRAVCRAANAPTYASTRSSTSRGLRRRSMVMVAAQRDESSLDLASRSHAARSSESSGRVASAR